MKSCVLSLENLSWSISMTFSFIASLWKTTLVIFHKFCWFFAMQRFMPTFLNAIFAPTNLFSWDLWFLPLELKLMKRKLRQFVIGLPQHRFMKYDDSMILPDFTVAL